MPLTFTTGSPMRTPRLAAIISLASLISCNGATDAQVQQLVDYVLQYCGTLPLWVATQAQANGPWTQVTLNGSGQATIPLGEKFGLATVRQSGTSYFTYITYITKTELPSFTGTCATSAGSKTINGSISTLSAGTEAQVRMDGQSAFLNAGASSNFSLTGVTNGAKDLFAHRRITSTGAEDKIIVRRGQDIAAAATMSQLNFGAAEAVTPASATVTLTGVGVSESRSVFHSLYTTNAGNLGNTFFNSPSATNTSGTVFGLPTAQAVSTDMSQIGVNVSGTNSTRGVNLFTHTFGNATLAVGPTLSPTVTSISATPKKLRLQLPSQSEYGGGLEFAYYQTTVGAYRLMDILISAAYLGGAPGTWDVQAPDLTGVTGYPAAAEFGTATAMWDVQVYSTFEAYFKYYVNVTDNTVEKWAYQYSSVAVSPNESSLRTSQPSDAPRRARQAFGR
jgi:hypothetical protein